MLKDLESQRVNAENSKKDDERKSDCETKEELDFDAVLIHEIGQAGLFQIVTFLTAALSVLYSSAAAQEYIFTAARLKTRCLIPECETTGATEWEPAWLGNAVPGAPGAYDQCSRYAPLTSPVLPNDTCTDSIFDQSTLLNCEKYVHQQTNTIVYDFGLECDEWRRALVGSIRTFGYLVSMPLTGLASDRWGRKVVFCVSAFIAATLGIIKAFATSYEFYLVFMFLEAAFNATYGTAFILLTEFVAPNFRRIIGPLLSCFAAVGYVCTGLMAWAITEWRTFTLVVFAPQLLSLAFFWLLPESVRWLMSKGRYDDAEKQLKTAARMNKVELSANTMSKLREASLRQENRKKLGMDEKEPLLVHQVLRSRIMIYRCCVASVWWISGIMVYYGITINAVNLYGDMYVNYILVAIVEIPGFLTAMFLLGKVGRKKTLFLGYFICALCMFGFAYLETARAGQHNTLKTVLFLLGNFLISMTVTSLYLYTSELFPTQCRHSLLSFCSMAGRIGGIIAPLTPALAVYWEGIPSVLFGSLACISSLLILITPETLGTKLPDTILEAENILQRVYDKRKNLHNHFAY